MKKRRVISAACAVVLIALAYQIFMKMFVWGFTPQVQFAGSPLGNIPVEKVLFYHNPPGLRGDGPSFAIYRVRDFDTEEWIKAYNKAGLHVLCTDALDKTSLWVRGPIKDIKYIRAFEYVDSGANGTYDVQAMIKRFPWRSWVRSNSVWFNFRQVSGARNTDGSVTIRGGRIWILDAKNHRLYLMGATV